MTGWVDSMMAGSSTRPAAAAAIQRRDGEAAHAAEIKTGLWHAAYWEAGLGIMRQRGIAHALLHLETARQDVGRRRQGFVEVGGHGGET